jgi:glutamine synthetase
MKEWATRQGATHYTHWFQPMNGYTAEKHDSFISLNKNGGIDLKFGGFNLVRSPLHEYLFINLSFLLSFSYFK